MKDQWVGLRDVLDLLNVTKTRVSQLVKDGKLTRQTHGRSGRRFLYDLQTVLDLAYARETAAWERHAEPDALYRILAIRRAGQEPLGDSFGFAIESPPVPLPAEPKRKLTDIEQADVDNLDAFIRLNRLGRDPDGQYTTTWIWDDPRIR